MLIVGSGGGRLASSPLNFSSASRSRPAGQPDHRLPELLDLGLDRVGLRLPGGLFAGARQHDVVFLRRGQERLEAVVVFLRDRVELVIVAAGTADRQAEEHDRGRVGHLGQHFVAAEGDFLVAGVPPDRTEAVEAGRDLQFVAVGIDLVAGQLLQHEAVERLVVVERLDDVVAVAPRPGAVAVVLEALGLGVAHDIEPVPAPLLAVVRGREQPIDQLLVGVGRRIVDEGIDLLRRRRQPGQVEGDPADERGPVGLRRRRQSFLSSRARMKASTGLRIANFGFRTSGTAGRMRGRSDQCVSGSAAKAGATRVRTPMSGSNRMECGSW